jgi:hypothetical protein
MNYQELIGKVNCAIKEFSDENCTCNVEESIHIEWVIKDAEEMIQKLKELLPEVKKME